MKENTINWRQKLSSRKFWAAIIGFVVSMAVALGVSDMSTERIVAVISSLSILVIYVVGETIVDSKKPPAVGLQSIDWKAKLTSRKFWAALIGFISTLLIAIGCPDMTIDRVTGIITAVSTIAIYILGESAVDASNISKANKIAEAALYTAELKTGIIETSLDEAKPSTCESYIEDGVLKRKAVEEKIE